MEFAGKYRQAVSDTIKEIVPDDGHAVDQMVRYHLGLHEGTLTGKMVRSHLCLAMYEAWGGGDTRVGNRQSPAADVAVAAAAAVELIHRCSLIFDDIQDGATDRNGHSTVWAKYGADRALNAGLALSTLPRRLLHRTKDNRLALRVLDILEDAVYQLCKGQEEDLSASVSWETARYMEMVRKKTGVLLGIASGIGAMLANGDYPSAYDFGENLGVLFQLQDDILGVWGKKTGKTSVDLDNGKLTLVTLVGLRSRVPGFQEFLEDARTDQDMTLPVDPGERAELVAEMKGKLEEAGVDRACQTYKKEQMKRTLLRLARLREITGESRVMFRNLTVFAAEREV